MTTIKLDQFTANTVETSDASLTVSMPEKKLPVGQHTFQLQVEDDSGNTSTAAQVMMIVIDDTAPTAVLTLEDENGLPIANNRVSYGSGFTLSGKRSVDIGGSIIRYTWTLID
jgi:hypothetical protein